MDYDVLINNAIKKNEVLQLLRGEKEYEIIISEFSPDIFPTDINTVLVNCFYQQKEKIDGIDSIFVSYLDKLLSGDASDIYIAVLYFDACIFQEERKKSTFVLNKEVIASSIKQAVNLKKNELKDKIIFKNGMIKKNPWRNIENFNKYYHKKYGIDII